MLQELHLPSTAVLHHKRWRFVEEIPSQRRYCVHTDEQIVNASPADARMEDESVADRRCEAAEGDTPEKDVALGKKAPFHRYDFTDDNCI